MYREVCLQGEAASLRTMPSPTNDPVVSRSVRRWPRECPALLGYYPTTDCLCNFIKPDKITIVYAVIYFIDGNITEAPVSVYPIAIFLNRHELVIERRGCPEMPCTRPTIQ